MKKLWKFYQIFLLSTICAVCSSLPSTSTTIGEIDNAPTETESSPEKDVSSDNGDKTISRKEVIPFSNTDAASPDKVITKRNVAHFARVRSFGMSRPVQDENPYFSNYGKRHFSSLLKFRQNPWFGNYYQNFGASIPMISAPEPNELPDDLLPYPTKKHISSLIKNRSTNNDPEVDYLLDMDNYYEIPEKRHIGSLRNSRYMYLLHRNGKRYIGSLLKNSKFHVGQQNKRHLGSIMKRDFDLSDDDYYLTPAKEDLSEEAAREKKHIASLIKNRPRMMYKREISYNDKDQETTTNYNEDGIYDNSNEEFNKRHISSLFQDRDYDSIDKRKYVSYRPAVPDNIDNKLYKRYLSSLFDKRHYSSILDNQYSPYEKQPFPFLNLNINEPQEKRHISSLLKNGRYYYKRNLVRADYSNEINDEIASQLENIQQEQPYNKRFFRTLLRDEMDAEKRNIAPTTDISDFNLNKQYSTPLIEGVRCFHDTEKEKRHIASLRQNNIKSDYDHDFIMTLKRHIASLRQGKRESPDGPYNQKRHIASLRQGKRQSTADGIDEKRHIASLRQGKRDPTPEGVYEKRHIASLRQGKRDSDANIIDEKRHLASLRQGKRNSDNNIVDEKRHIASLRQGKRDSDDNIIDEKRHLASLRQGKRDSDNNIVDEKRHIASLRQGKRDSDDDIIDEKRHLASLRQDKRDSSEGFINEKKHIGSLRQEKRDRSEEEMIVEKKHLSSLLNKKRNSDYGKDIADEDQRLSVLKSLMFVDPSMKDDKRSFASLLKSSSYSPHSRTKRHIGALAKSNDLPFRPSRGYRYPGAYSRSFSMLNFINKYLSEQLNKVSLRNEIRDSEKSPHALDYYGEDDMDIAGRSNFIFSDDANSEESDDYSDEKPFQSPNKRFLGSLARQNWFPRPYRRFTDESRNYGSLTSLADDARYEDSYPYLDEESNRPSYGSFLPLNRF